MSLFPLHGQERLVTWERITKLGLGVFLIDFNILLPAINCMLYASYLILHTCISSKIKKSISPHILYKFSKLRKSNECLMLIYLGDVSLLLIDYLTNFFLFKLHEDADTWREKVESASAVSGESAMVRDSDVNWEYSSSEAVDISWL